MRLTDDQIAHELKTEIIKCLRKQRRDKNPADIICKFIAQGGKKLEVAMFEDYNTEELKESAMAAALFILEKVGE